MSVELPTGKTLSFIAYGQPEAMSAENGETVTGRPQVFVRHFDAIKIANVKDGGRNGTDTVAIEFDAQSVGFDNNFSAYMNPTDPTLDTMRAAHQSGAALAIALESVRKVKTKREKTAIAKQTPIHALRGAQPDGTGAKMDESGDAIRNIVAMVDGRPTETIQSDPAEWKFLVKNRAGDLAPQGWRIVVDKDDWKKAGYIVPAGTGTAPGTIDESVINMIITGVVEGLSGYLPGAGGIHSSEIAKEVRRGVFNEGKPWNPRTSNGMVNLGGFLLSKHRAVFEHAFTVTGDVPEAQHLTRRILGITDWVQEQTYGHGITADRLASSHGEAGKWVKFTIDHASATGLPYPMQAATSEEEVAKLEQDRSAWSDVIAKRSASLFRDASATAGEYLATMDRRQPEPRVQGTTQREALRHGAATSAPSASSADSASSPQTQEHAVGQLLNVIQQTNGNRAGLATLLAQVRERRMEGTVVAARFSPTFEVVLPASLSDNTGWNQGSVGDLLAFMIDGATTEAPGERSAPTVAAEPAEAAEAPASSSRSAEPDAYAPALQSVLSDLATPTPNLKALYGTARDSNLLDEKVAFTLAHDGSLVFGPLGTPGLIEQPLSAILERLLDREQDREQDRAENAAETSAGPAAVPQEAVPEESAPQGPESHPNVSRAQELATAAKAHHSVWDKASIEALIAQAKQEGLQDEVITDGDMEGGLQHYLYHLIETLGSAD